jgi:hypothetical protein
MWLKIYQSLGVKCLSRRSDWYQKFIPSCDGLVEHEKWSKNVIRKERPEEMAPKRWRLNRTMNITSATKTVCSNDAIVCFSIIIFLMTLDSYRLDDRFTFLSFLSEEPRRLFCSCDARVIVSWVVWSKKADQQRSQKYFFTRFSFEISSVLLHLIHYMPSSSHLMLDLHERSPRKRWKNSTVHVHLPLSEADLNIRSTQ